MGVQASGNVTGHRWEVEDQAGVFELADLGTSDEDHYPEVEEAGGVQEKPMDRDDVAAGKLVAPAARPRDAVVAADAEGAVA